MRVFSRSKDSMRAWVAVVAAGVFVLQLLLTGILSTQMAVAAPADSFAICHASADPANDSRHPPSDAAHGADYPCIICSFASAGGLAPSLVTVTFVRIGKAVIAQQSPLTRVVVSRQRSPQVPQGPPQTA